MPKPSPPALQGPSSVGCLTKQGDVSITDGHSKLTSAIGATVEASMLGPSVPSCRDSNKIFNNLYVPLPNRITTPVNVNNLSRELEGYPDPEIAAYLVAAITSGFSLGYTGSRFVLAPKKWKFALDNETHVTAAIIKELDRKHTDGPFLSPLIELLHCSPLGAVPKKDGSWRLILDLSSPRDYSVNKYISKEEFSVILSKFDDALNLVGKLGKGALMAKLDIRHAFRIIPVNPQDWDLLGTVWKGYYFVEL